MRPFVASMASRQWRTNRPLRSSWRCTSVQWFTGTLGPPSELDFTVIGPAVNLVSRFEATAKTLNTAIVLSDDFARACGRPLTSLGYHPLRGLVKPHELFAPAIGTQPAQAS